MYPYPLFLNINLYTVFLCLGVLGAVVAFRIFADVRKVYWKVQNLVIMSTAVAVVGGYFFAVLFQALYNIEKRGELIIDASTGATFYGGLIGGAACFLAFYFIVGPIYLKGKEHIGSFFTVADIGAGSIALAHALGRLGCLFAGCCHGGETDAWYGIYMVNLGYKVVPVQLFEALFLFALFGFFVYRLIKGGTYCLPLYMVIYGVWRFLIEYLRTDHRGATVVDFLTPSQFIAVLMTVGAALLYLGQRCYIKRRREQKRDEEVTNEE
jgi:phosphatidylglycerol:prolipoprotein diacylglycerol transferase